MGTKQCFSLEALLIVYVFAYSPRIFKLNKGKWRPTPILQVYERDFSELVEQILDVLSTDIRWQVSYVDAALVAGTHFAEISHVQRARLEENNFFDFFLSDFFLFSKCKWRMCDRSGIYEKRPTGVWGW